MYVTSSLDALKFGDGGILTPDSDFLQVVAALYDMWPSFMQALEDEASIAVVVQRRRCSAGVVTAVIWPRRILAHRAGIVRGKLASFRAQPE